MALPWRQKIVVAFIFSLGIFVIIAALLTKVFNLTDVYDAGYMLWYIREASVAVYMSNLPMIWPLLREWFPCLRALTPGAGRTYERQNRRTAATSRYVSRRSARRMTILSGKASGSTTLRSPSLEPAPGIHPKDPTYDIEMAIRGVDSDEDSKSGKHRSRYLGDQPRNGGWHDASSIDEIVRVKTPPRSVSRATTVESGFRFLQLEQEARDVVMSGIKVQTSFSVQEETATPPQSSQGGPSPEPWAPTRGDW